jgi:hypothetical protein
MNLSSHPSFGALASDVDDFISCLERPTFNFSEPTHRSTEKLAALLKQEKKDKKRCATDTYAPNCWMCQTDDDYDEYDDDDDDVDDDH